MGTDAHQAQAIDWNHWFYLRSSDTPRPRKSDVAEQLGLTPAQFSQRLSPNRYQPPVSDREIELTAAMWNQPPEYVRTIFPKSPAKAATKAA